MKWEYRYATINLFLLDINIWFRFILHCLPFDSAIFIDVFLAIFLWINSWLPLQYVGELRRWFQVHRGIIIRGGISLTVSSHITVPPPRQLESANLMNMHQWHPCYGPYVICDPSGFDHKLLASCSFVTLSLSKINVIAIKLFNLTSGSLLTFLSEVWSFKKQNISLL